MALALVQCGPSVNDARLKRGVPPGHTTSDVSWSPGHRCAAFNIMDAEGHSPMTTTRVAVASAATKGYQELRLPPPNQIFSTFIDQWESPGVLRIRATTLDGDLHALYYCDTHRLIYVR